MNLEPLKTHKDEERPPVSGWAWSRCSFENQLAWLIPLVIALATFSAFSPILKNGFVHWDDWPNFVENPNYRGLGWLKVKWMFTTMHMGTYQPLCWLTFAVDYLVWGMNPFGYHLTNLLLHAANAVVFYQVGQILLSKVGYRTPEGRQSSPSIAAGLAALLFAVHPLRVESVAWATERKDVLSGFFYLCAVYAYLRPYVDQSRTDRVWLVLSWLAFGLSLLAKGIGITLPIVFIMLDFYPLRRLPRRFRECFSGAFRRVWLAKVPFLVPAVLIAATGYKGQRGSGSLVTESAAAHCAKALFGLSYYLWKTLWPLNLTPMYEQAVRFDPFARPFLVCGAAVGLITGVLMLYRRWPAGLAAWFCYIAISAPVLGIVSFGSQLAADRYSYLACLPWPILAAAGFDWVWQRTKSLYRRMLELGSAMVIVVLMSLTWRQAQIWHDDESLWRHAISVRPQSSIAHNNLATALAERSKLEEAAEHFSKAINIKPDFALVQYNWGNVLCRLGKYEEGFGHYREALKINAAYAEVHHNWGYFLERQGRTQDAIGHYRRAVELNPSYAEAQNGLGSALQGQGKSEEAAEHFREALKINPVYAEAHNNFGNALLGQGKREEAMEQYRAALEINPAVAETHFNLGYALCGQGKLDAGISHFRQALSIKPAFARAQYYFGMALYDQGKVREAMGHYREALKIDPAFTEAQYSLGNALYARGNVEEAIARYRQALRVEPGDARALPGTGLTLDLPYQETLKALAHSNWGDALRNRGKFEEAVEHYREALQIQPVSPQAHNNLGVCLMHLGKPEEAADHFRQALQINPSYAAARDNLSHVLTQFGRSP